MQTERVILAEIYLDKGKIGFKYTMDANRQEVNYFLESFVRLERKYFNKSFEKTDFDDEL